ncbi:unnamed protein product [Didymodactylos carnosus]|uniref:Uncharacterized protein n=1 Tax=Didymodactylos carnosus TaxID=1234261 RepID=A0A8S2G1Q2_9BILA|nr:unnamed protein product [Didymodactylos carnosus]CAF4410366.1 unnamed protein product [Didymodactylos carnosus]
MIQRGEPLISHNKPPPPVIEENKTTSKFTSTAVGNNLPTSSIFTLTEPLPSLKTKKIVKELDEKWQDMFDTNDNNKKQDTTKDDLLAKLTSATPPTSSSKSIVHADDKKTTTTKINKPLERTNSRGYDFDLVTMNLHEGRPANATFVNKTDPFESIFNTNTKTSTTTTNQHDLNDIFASKTTTNTTKEQKTDLFDSLFGPPQSTKTTTSDTITPSSIKTNSNSSKSDKLQRPKIVTNANRSVPNNNRAVVEEVEEFIL